MIVFFLKYFVVGCFYSSSIRKDAEKKTKVWCLANTKRAEA